MRYVDHLLTPNGALMCHDLKTKFTCLLEREAGGSPISPAWGGAVYYTRGTELRCASLESCETRPVMELAELPPCWQLMSVSSDERLLNLIYTTMGFVELDGSLQHCSHRPARQDLEAAPR